MPDLPTGTVTFLFSDIEHSTRLLQHLGDQWAGVLTEYRRQLRAAFQAGDGYEIDTAGDGFFVAFRRATQAVAAAVVAQRALAAYTWPEGALVRARMGLHTGEPTLAAEGYVGLDVHRAARICAAGHGGQSLLSQTTHALVADDLPAGVTVRHLGEHRLKDLQRSERLYQLVIPGVPADFPPLKTLDSRANNLPAQLTVLIGREREGAAVGQLLQRDEVRLLTLTGSGGTGKTRLGLQVAADLLEDFEHGVFFVPLATISDPTLVAATIAQTLGVPEKAGQLLLTGLKDYLRHQQTLLVLDNFEQVVAAAPVVAELLTACPRLKLLVTSRVGLRLRGEHEFSVPPLALPDPQHLPPAAALSQYAAVELFIQRALALKADFAVTNENAPAVAEICIRLDGLPLAIELAAARSKLLPPRAILARLESRLELLRGGAQDLPARHQTLRRAIAWSYDLLDASEQRLFRRLAVFVGGCTLEAAEAGTTINDPAAGVGAPLQVDVLDGMASLVDKSLLRPEEVRGEPRFRMLETIREYGLECLTASGEAPAIRCAHAAYYLTLVETAAPALAGPEQATWLELLETEHDNLRAALHWAMESAEVEHGLRLAGALCQFWLARGYLREGREYLARLLLLGGTSTYTVARAKVLAGAGNLAHNQGDYAAAQALFEESLALWREVGDKPGIATSLTNLGLTAHHQGDYTVACALHQESLALRRALEDTRGVAFSLTLLGWTVCRQSDYGRAATLFEEAQALFQEVGMKQLFAFAAGLLAEVAQAQGDDERAVALLEASVILFRDIGDRYGLALTLGILGAIVSAQGDDRRATALYEESLALRTAIGDRWGMASSLSQLGAVVHQQGDDGRATALYEESLALRRALGDRHGTAECLEGLAGIAVAQRQLQRAVRLLGTAAALRQEIGAPLLPHERARYDRNVAATRAELGDAVFMEMSAAGKATPPEQASTSHG